MEKKKALVLGASGLIGKELVTKLLNHPAYEQVVVLTRKSLQLKHEKLSEHLISFDTLEEYSPLFAVDVVFCALGTTRKKAGSKQAFEKVDYEYPMRAAKIAQMYAHTFVLVSSIGAQMNASNFYLHVKGKTEKAIFETTLSSIYILRPSILLGNRTEERPGEKIGIRLARILNPIMLGGLKKYKGIEASTVAEAMLKMGIDSKPGKHIFESHEIQYFATGKQGSKLGKIVPNI